MLLAEMILMLIIAIYIYFKLMDKIVECDDERIYSDCEKEIWVDLERILGCEVDLIILNHAAPTIEDSGLRGIPIVLTFPRKK